MTKIEQNLQRVRAFSREICAISNAEVPQSRRQTQRWLDRKLRRRRACFAVHAAHAGRVLHPSMFCFSGVYPI